MKKLSLLIALTSFLLVGCTSVSQQSNPSNNSGDPEKEQVEHNYEISETKVSIQVDGSTKLYVSDNGTLLSNVTWKSSNVKVAVVDNSGTVTGIKEGKVTITGTIDKENFVVCEVTVTAKEVTPTPGPVVNNDTEIVKFFKNNSDLVEGTIYCFVSSKSKWDYLTSQSYIWNMYFMYDTSDDTYIIKSQMSGTSSSGIEFNYYGYNVFNWGDYKNGYFLGGYNQQTSKGSETYANFEILFDTSTIVFRTDYSLTYYDLSYSVTKNEFSSSVSADDVLAVFNRVSECTSYADEMFTKYNVNLSLY